MGRSSQGQRLATGGVTGSGGGGFQRRRPPRPGDVDETAARWPSCWATATAHSRRRSSILPARSRRVVSGRFRRRRPARPGRRRLFQDLSDTFFPVIGHTVFGVPGKRRWHLPSAGLLRSGRWLRTGAIATGDFNGDGRPDLAVTNLEVSSILLPCLLLGNGDGTFRFPGPVPKLGPAEWGRGRGLRRRRPARPRLHPDPGNAGLGAPGSMATGRSSPSQVARNGRITFSASLHSRSGGDFDGDGRLDLADDTPSGATGDARSPWLSATGTAPSRPPESFTGWERDRPGSPRDISTAPGTSAW